MTTKPFVITFAGVPGSSKSIVAFYLSEVYSLPILNSDNIRYEVKEDLLVNDIRQPKALKEFEKRMAERFNNLLGRKVSFIRDASVDRRWTEVRQRLEDADYRWCLIDMELSRDFLVKLYTKTGRYEALEELDIYLEQHAKFLEKYESDITLKITDEMFKDRSKVAEEAVRKFIYMN